MYNRKAPNYKHGESGTKLYYVWKGIKNRCNNPNNKSYKCWGGRGITVCPEWTESYIVFRDWSLSNGYKEGLTIDRKENDGNYEPSNCRFITNAESLRNTSRNVTTMEIANEIRKLYKTGLYTQKELTKKFGLTSQTISNIINNKRWKS